ncbi:P-selectin-like protein [Dinothrombium tinctorium]|uniref:P-selectin-like protein n=1 Tax=Dinothrombium tinctorium TaxID=1965070 RepID=A0A3S3P9N0_9ACAR|nr:P-selectin-like protein [Dinothrombium tinctorium]
MFIEVYNSCPPLNSLDDQIIVSDNECGNEAGDVCTFSCKRNYQVIGTAEISCLPNGQWTRQQPICIDPSIRCTPQLTAPVNGFFIDECLSFGNFVCRFGCIQGFSLLGSSAVRCDATTRSWSSNAPQCVPQQVNCPALSTPPNGVKDGSCNGYDSFAASTCNFFCNAGYQLQGMRVLTCLNNGAWNGNVPTCVRVVLACPALPTPVNGIITGVCGNNSPPGSTCNFSCRPGYRLIGQSALRCNSDGTWNANIPQCQALTCSRLRTPENGQKTGNCENGTPVGSQCMFICNPGFETIGQAVLICQSNGRWNADEPRCESAIPTCSALDAPEYGTKAGVCDEGAPVGSTCTFFCNNGYRLRGEQRLVCQPDGSWDEEIPICIRQVITCRELRPPANGAIQGTCRAGAMAGSRCLFSCTPGFQIQGEPILTCLANGQWSSISPTCIPLPRVTCSELRPPPNGITSGMCESNSSVGSQCSFSCNPGFRLLGSAVLTCLSSGAWNGITPQCIPITCPQLRPPSNGFASGMCENGSLPGSRCTFSCNPGFNLRGSGVLICLLSGQWNNNPPTCAAVPTTTCRGLQAPQNGVLAGMCGENSPIGSRCSFTCNPGFVLQGSSILTCLSNGNWNSLPPLCITQEITCPALDRPENGIRLGTCQEGAPVGAICRFRCEPGYTLLGKRQLVCQVDGTWDEEVPECREVGRSCPSINPPLFGSVTGNCNPGVENGICIFGCNTGYNLVGTPVLVCLRNGSWSANPPSCRRGRQGCRVPILGTGVIMGYCNTAIGGLCYYGCRYAGVSKRRVDYLYSPNAATSESRSSYLVCREAGQWTGSRIICRPRFPFLYGISFAG